mmetsp:Transcript_30982/g.42629  ORF Transcript_30982/g.42629 Transcript_30982/m.42629 type:complete len:183 (+) Transcript_30982:361-909(+)
MGLFRPKDPCPFDHNRNLRAISFDNCLIEPPSHPSPRRKVRKQLPVPPLHKSASCQITANRQKESSSFPNRKSQSSSSVHNNTNGNHGLTPILRTSESKSKGTRVRWRDESSKESLTERFDCYSSLEYDRRPLLGEAFRFDEANQIRTSFWIFFAFLFFGCVVSGLLDHLLLSILEWSTDSL